MTTLTLPSAIDPEALLVALDKAACEQSLAEFIKRAWKQLEPGQLYLHGWHVDFIAEHLEAITNGEKVDGEHYSRLLVNIPPGAMKSMMVNIFWPAWEWGPKNKPHLRYVAAAHNIDLAMRDNLRLRRLIMSEWYQERWGARVEITEDQNTKLKFENKAGGWRHALAAGSITGVRGDRVTIDDPISAVDANSEATRESVNQWFCESVPTRLNNPDSSAIVVIMQRLHERDVSGVILDGDMGYDHICLPMEYDPDRACITKLGYEDPRTERDELLFPGRFPRDVVDRDKRILGPYASAGQFQQSPVPRGGGIIKDADWQLWSPPEYPPLDFVLASLDTAYTEKTSNDCSALTVWGVFSGRHEERATRLVDRYGKPYAEARSGGIEGMSKVVLMFAFAERLELHALVKRVAETCKAMKVDRLLIESKASGISVAQEMRRLYGHEQWAVHLINPGAQDKMARLYSVQHLFSEGMIFAPDKKWAEEVIRQVASFPKAKHDDLCLVAGTLIATKRGRVPIEEVCAGDMALTPLGWRRVSAAGLTGWRAVVTARGLTGTGGHPVFTLDEGFAPLGTISQASRTVGLGLCDLMKTMRLRTCFLTGSGTAGWGASGNTTSANPAVMQDERTPRGCTSLFGKSTTANRWAKVARSITLTAILLTSALKIWSAYRKMCIEDCLRSILIGKWYALISKSNGLLRPRGTSLTLAGHGISGSTGLLLNKLCGQAGNACQKAKTVLCSVCTLVSGVVNYFIAGMYERCFVLLRAIPPNQNVHAERLKDYRSNGRISVDGVASGLSGAIKRQNFAACHASQQSTGLRKQLVYNLTVEGAHCYYANGVLVHNCDSTSQAIRHLRDTGLLIRADERLAELADSMDYANIRTPEPLYDA